MNRIDTVLQGLRSKGKKMLSPYITAGDPHPDYTVELMHALVKSGADILEIGIPFSDPMAEGVVIQAAMERALAYDVNCEDIFAMIDKFRQHDKDTGIILMGYLNPIVQYGIEKFATKAQEAGVDGTIIVDLPPEESTEIGKIWQAHNLYPIYLCSPTTTDLRMSLINQCGKGYLYYVSLKGVTGSGDFNLEQVQQDYDRRKKQVNLPLMVGFGIKTPTMAAKVAEFADGVIVGAALINTIYEAYIAKENICTAAATLITGMRLAMDGKK